jgi:hypothetical protein
MGRWYHKILRLCFPLRVIKEPNFIMQIPREKLALTLQITYLNDMADDDTLHSMPFTPVEFKRYHKKKAEKKAAKDIVKVCTQASSSLSFITILIGFSYSSLKNSPKNLRLSSFQKSQLSQQESSSTTESGQPMS